MSDPATKQVICIWNEVAFPLWHTPRPQFELFAETLKIIKKYTRWEVTSNYEELAKSGDRREWLHWKIRMPIDEAQRTAIQKELQEVYGDDQGKHFRWHGTRTIVTVGDVIAMGPYIQ